MRTILHIFTRPEDELRRELIAQQQAMDATTVEFVDLTSGSADYNAIVDKIFAADSVEVW